MPIAEEIYKVLFEDKNPRQAVEDLMLRDVKEEMKPNLESSAATKYSPDTPVILYAARRFSSALIFLIVSCLDILISFGPFYHPLKSLSKTIKSEW